MIGIGWYGVVCFDYCDYVFFLTLAGEARRKNRRTARKVNAVVFVSHICIDVHACRQTQR